MAEDNHNIESYIQALKKKENKVIRNIGLILLAVLLFALSLGWLGVLTIPGILLGILGFATGIMILIGR